MTGFDAAGLQVIGLARVESTNDVDVDLPAARRVVEQGRAAAVLDLARTQGVGSRFGG